MKWFQRLLITLVLLIGISSIATAQGGVLAFDTLVADNYAGSPVIYTFTGTQDDVVSITVLGGAGLQPTLALSNSSGQLISFASGDPLTPTPNDARITAKLPANDTFIITLNSHNGTTGPFTILLSASMTVPSAPATGTSTVTIDPQTSAQVYTIAGNPFIPQILSLQGLRPDDFFTAQVQDPAGTVIVSIAGGINGTALVLPESEGSYTLTLGAVEPESGTLVEVAVFEGATPSMTGDAPAQDADACIITGNGVNLRGGPGTNYGIVGALLDGRELTATGQNNGWYYGTYDGQTAWVAASVVNAAGNCGNLPFVDAPSPPEAPEPQATAVPATQTTDAPPPQTTEEAAEAQPTSLPPTQSTQSSATNDLTQQPTTTTAPTMVSFVVNSLTCTYQINDGATVFFNIDGPANASFRLDVRFGSTTYSVDRTLNAQGFISGNQRFAQAGNSNYVAYVVYNGQDIASADC